MTVVSEQDQAAELPERWSAKAKTNVVRRLLRGEAVDGVSREVQVPAHELEAWRRTFLEAGGEALKKRYGEGDTRLLKQAQAKAGELARGPHVLGQSGMQESDSVGFGLN